MMIPLTLNSLAIAFAECEAVATPHREPDFAWLNANAENGFASEVKGTMVFIEENNTGYNGWLHRWIFSVIGKDGKRIEFQCDLLPDQIKTDGNSIGEAMHKASKEGFPVQLSQHQRMIIVSSLMNTVDEMKKAKSFDQKEIDGINSLVKYLQS